MTPSGPNSRPHQNAFRTASFSVPKRQASPTQAAASATQIVQGFSRGIQVSALAGFSYRGKVCELKT